MNTGQVGSILGAILPLILATIPIAIMAYKLAIKKGYSPALWTVLALTPGVNFFVVWYFAGVPDKHLEAKLDRLLLMVETLCEEKEIDENKPVRVEAGVATKGG